MSDEPRGYVDPQWAAQLLCGVFGHLDDDDADTGTVRVGGTGVRVGASHVLTARHVTRDLFATNPDRADDLRRRLDRLEPSGSMKLPLRMSVVQAGESTSAEALVWGITGAWESPVTDLTVVEVRPNNGPATKRFAEAEASFPEWSLGPPPAGAEVQILGMPANSMSVSRGTWVFSFPQMSQPATVVEACDEGLGMYKFPGFIVDVSVQHGVSGGPVFWNGRLCGLVSGGWDGKTYVASLWPLLLMAFPSGAGGSGGELDTFERWLDAGLLKSRDWPELKSRIRFTTDEYERPFAFLKPPTSPA